MSLTKEQLTQIKKQLFQQIDSTFPEDKKESARQQIESMDDKQIEDFLKQNNLVKEGDSQECVFCSIISEKIPSYRISQNNQAIAILEINPISKGHCLIIPKEHISTKEKLSNEVLQLAKEIEKKVKEELKPKNVLIENSNLFGHEAINVLPVYDNETINSKKYKAEEKELLELQKLLTTKPKPKTFKKPKTEKVKEKLWLPIRIP